MQVARVHHEYGRLTLATAGLLSDVCRFAGPPLVHSVLQQKFQQRLSKRQQAN